MTIQTHLVGTLGGSRVEITPGISISSDYETTTTITTLHVPAGETWLAVLSGTMTTLGTTPGTAPLLMIGDTSSQVFAGPSSVVAEITDTTTVSLVTLRWEAEFTGTLYTIRL